MQVNKIFSLFTARELVSLFLGAVALIVTIRLAPLYQDIALLKNDVSALEQRDVDQSDALIRIEDKLDSLILQLFDR